MLGNYPPTGTKIIKYNGTLVPVEDIKPGDRLMGPDSKPRTVQSVSRGYGPLVTVIPNKGGAWTWWECSPDHVLTLVRSERRYRGQTFDVSVDEWRQWTESQKDRHKLFRVSVDYPCESATLPVDSYFLGVLLRGGRLTGSAPKIGGFFHQERFFNSSEIVEACEAFAQSWELTLKCEKGRDAVLPIYSFSGRKSAMNPLTIALRRLNVWGKKPYEQRIPFEYLTASREERLALLAGLLDTHGHLDVGCFKYSCSSEGLARDVAQIARSIGLAVYTTMKAMPYEVEGRKSPPYLEVSISGNTHIIPTRVRGKQAPVRQRKKDVIRTGFDIEDRDEGEYFGFTLDGDGRYLLEDFTVTGE